MTNKKITITVTIEVPDGGTVAMQDATTDHDRAVIDDGMAFAEANVRLRPFLRRFEDAVRAHDIRIERPDAERQDYRNVFPPPGYGASRLGSVNITSGRAMSYLEFRTSPPQGRSPRYTATTASRQARRST